MATVMIKPSITIISTERVAPSPKDVPVKNKHWYHIIIVIIFYLTLTLSLFLSLWYKDMHD
jgi:hypothetical protein